jgi:3',5'-cyclic AMP phosphodiesterase CpdA
MSRFVLKVIFSVLSFIFLISENATAQKDTISFLHITDLHVVFSPGSYRPEIMENRALKNYDQGESRFRRFLQVMPQKTGSDLVIATGDLVDFFEAETNSGESVVKREQSPEVFDALPYGSHLHQAKLLDIQAGQFADLTAGYNVPCLFTLGNHDLFSFVWQGNKLSHHQNSSGHARALWTRNLPCFRNGTYYSRLFRVGKTTYRLLFLDNSFYKFSKDDKTAVPYIDKAQLYWLDAQLNEASDDVEIILMHIPFNDEAAVSGSVCELYAALSKVPSVRLILAGHRHKNEITSFPSAENHKIVQVQTGALVNDEDNWRQIRLTENQIQVSCPGKTTSEMVIPLR